MLLSDGRQRRATAGVVGVATRQTSRVDTGVATMAGVAAAF